MKRKAANFTAGIAAPVYERLLDRGAATHDKSSPAVAIAQAALVTQ
jgi:hypothetical protein